MSRRLIRSTSVVGGMTLGSRILGFVRDIVFARFFGAGAGMDVFVVAFQIPNFLRRLFAEGAFSQAFVPVLAEYHSQRSHDQVRHLADRVWGTLGVVLAVVTIVGVLAAPFLVLLFSSGFAADADKFDLAVDMLRVTFPYLLFISLTALAGGILNTFGRFGPPAFTPVLLNLCLIGAVIFVAPHFERPGIGLAIGVFVAGAVQLAFQFPFLRKIGMLPRPVWGWAHEGVKRIFRLMLPAIFGSSVAQLNLLIDRHIASWLATGSISWLYYSDRLMEFPLGVFAIALATVILPGLSASHADKRPEEFCATLDWALRLVTMIALPAAVALFVLAGPILSTLFQHGEFVANDTRMASYSLKAYAVGLLGFTLVKVLAPGYFARQNTIRPVRIGIVAMLANIVLNVTIVVPMAVTGFVAPHMGLALATGLSAFLNAGLLYRGLRLDKVYTPGEGWGKLLAQASLANAAMAAVLIYLAGDLDRWVSLPGLDRALWLAGCIGAGIVVYFAALVLVGVRPGDFRMRSGLSGGGPDTGPGNSGAGGHDMELIRDIHNLRAHHHGCVATIGNFDGVHTGHHKVLEGLKADAARLKVPATVMCFEPTPMEFFRGDQAPSRLSRFREKFELLEAAGVDRLFCLRFDKAMASMAPEAFVRELLHDGLGVKHVVVGDDFRFGKNREGDFHLLERMGQDLGFSVDHTPTFAVDGERVSSSAVRAALELGEMAHAARLLGRPYDMIGHVIPGERLGRTLGFPTANIRPGRLVCPVSGVFAVRVRGIGPEPLPGVASVGTRPTVHGVDPLLEVHVFDFDGDLYGKLLRVDFIAKLRDEEKFDDVETMRQQMDRDAIEARRALDEAGPDWPG